MKEYKVKCIDTEIDPQFPEPKKIIDWSRLFRNKHNLDETNTLNISTNDLHQYLCNHGEIIQGDHLFSRNIFNLISKNIYYT